MPSHLRSGLNDDALGGSGGTRVEPPAPLMLVILIHQQDLVPLGTLRLVNGQAVAVIERTDKIVIIVIVKATALLDKHALRDFDLDAINQQIDRGIIRLKRLRKFIRDTVEDAVLVSAIPSF